MVNKKAILSESMALRTIQDIISIPGEYVTDGECVDAIIDVLKIVGIDVVADMREKQKEYRDSPEGYELMVQQKINELNTLLERKMV
jgi:hypothetical protein